MFTSVLIANRGEIACRIIRTCQKLGIRTIAVYSHADANALHTRMADEAIFIGNSPPNESYLCAEKIIDAAKQTRAQAIHPGYGFLSENVDFAEAVEKANIIFIGPNAQTMRNMGSKAGAKTLMQQHGVPVVPGYTGEDQHADVLKQEAERIGFPLMIKAAHGGGGKGMRIVHHTKEFSEALSSCQREAKNAFGKDRVLLERFVETPKHIEIQVFGDQHGHMLYLNERECSAQRRYQKIFEESPSPFVSPTLREQMGEAAIKAARAVGYYNAGTVEFIVNPQGQFYFMEMNMRLQVEHPVTEMILGLDLVEWQLRVAAGEALPLQQKDIKVQGHAIEVRLYAEDPEKNFLPSSGRITQFSLPKTTAHVRIDAGVTEKDTVSIFYDPMIAKLIVHDQDRPKALQQLKQALSSIAITGVRHNISFLESLIQSPVIIDNSIDTSYLDHHLQEILPQHQQTPDEISVLMATVAQLMLQEQQMQAQAKQTNEPDSPWTQADAWRPGHKSKRLICFQVNDQPYDLYAIGVNGCYTIHWCEQTFDIRSAYFDQNWLSITVAEKHYRRHIMQVDSSWIVHNTHQRFYFEPTSAFAYTPSEIQAKNKIIAPMPGRIIAIHTKIGAVVQTGDALLTMEAMKMEITLRTDHDATIEAIKTQVGDFVEADATLITFSQPT